MTKRIENTGNAFRKNVLLCHPYLASTDVGDENFISRSTCSGNSCSLVNVSYIFQTRSKIFKSYSNILKMENLIDASIQCDGDIGRGLNIRREGLRRRISKLRKIVVNRKEVKLDRAKKGVLVRQLHPSNNLFSKFHPF